MYEGLGIVNIEAQAAGLHTILSNNVPREAKVTENLVDFLSLSDLFELFYDITEFSRVWEDDNMVNYEKLLNFFDLILEEFDLYPIQNFK